MERARVVLSERFPRAGDQWRAGLFFFSCAVLLIVQIVAISRKWKEAVDNPVTVSSEEPYDDFSFGVRACVPPGALFNGALYKTQYVGLPGDMNKGFYAFSSRDHDLDQFVQIFNAVSGASGSPTASFINMSRPEVFSIDPFQGPFEYDIPPNADSRPDGGSCHYLNADAFVKTDVGAVGPDGQTANTVSFFSGYVLYQNQSGQDAAFQTAATLDIAFFRLHSKLPSTGSFGEWSSIILKEMDNQERLNILSSDSFSIDLAQSSFVPVKFSYTQYDTSNAYETFDPRTSISVPVGVSGMRRLVNASDAMQVMVFQMAIKPTGLFYSRYWYRVTYSFSTFASELGGTLGLLATLYSLMFPTLQVFPRSFRCMSCESSSHDQALYGGSTGTTATHLLMERVHDKSDTAQYEPPPV